jgi:O-antigen ligase
MEQKGFAGPSRLFRLAAPVLIGGGAVWMVALPADYPYTHAGWAMFARRHSLAIPLAEFAFVLAAMSASFSPVRALNGLPVITKIALVVGVILSVLVSFQPQKDHVSAAIGITKLLITGLFLLALVDARKSTDEHFFSRIWLGLGCGTVIYVVLWIAQIHISPPNGDEWAFNLPGVNNIRHVGQFGFVGFFAGVVCLFFYRRHPNTLWRWCVPLLFATTGWGLSLWTGSRGPVLASTFGVIVLVILGVGFRRQLICFTIASVVVASISIAFLPVPHSTYGMWGATAVSDLQEGRGHDASSGRWKMWKEAKAKVQQKPLLGWGIEQFATSGPDDTLQTRHPHNYVLQILFSGGLVGLSLAAVVIFTVLRRWRWPYYGGIGLAGFGCVVAMLLYSLYDGALYFSYPIMIFVLAITTSIDPQQPAPDR